MKKTHCLAILALLCALGLATPTVVSALLTSGASATSEVAAAGDTDNNTTVTVTEVDSSESLIAAVNNQAAAIKLTADIELTQDLSFTYAATLDLNGFQLSRAGTSSRIINVQAGASVIVTGKVGSTIKATGTGGVPIRVYGSTTTGGAKTQLTVDEDVTLAAQENEATSYGVIVSPTNGKAYNVEIAIYGQIDTYSGVYINGQINDTDIAHAPHVSISGATIAANPTGGAAIYAAGYGVWSITNSTLSGAIGIGAKAGQIVLSGSTITTTGEYVANVATNNNGINDAGAVFQIENNEAYAKNVDLKVVSGTYESGESVVFYQYPPTVQQGKTRAVSAEPQITILGGSFTANNEQHGAIFEGIDAERVTLTGGTFAATHGQNDVIAIAAKSGYELISNPDGSLSQKPTSGGSSSKPADDPEDEDPDTTPEQKPSNPDAGVAGTMGDYATNTSVMTAALVGILLVGGCWALYGIHRARSARLAEAKRAASRKTTAKKSTAVKKTAKKSTKSTAARKTVTTRRKK